jgi:hypothetical protein
LLAEIVRTPAGEVKETDKICQSVKRTKGQDWSSVEVKVPGKIEAINTIAKLCGWFTPQALDVKIESQAELQAVIAKLRGAPVRNGQCTGRAGSYLRRKRSFRTPSDAGRRRKAAISPEPLPRSYPGKLI